MKEKDCSKDKKNKPDLEDINRYEDVYDMKKLKEEVGIPLYPKPNTAAPAAAPAPVANAGANPQKSEIERLQAENEAGEN